MGFMFTSEVVAEVPSSAFQARQLHPDTAQFIQHARTVLTATPNTWVKVLEADTNKEAATMSGRMTSHKRRLTNGTGGTFVFKTRDTSVYARWTPDVSN